MAKKKGGRRPKMKPNNTTDSNSEASAVEEEYAGLDPQIVLEVEGVLFGFPRSQLMTSEVFRDMLTDQHLGSPKEGTEENPIRIEKISSVSLSQVKAFYKVLNCRRFAVEPTLSAQQWSEALQLATIWGFEILRDLAIGYLDCLLNDPLSRIELADGCDIEEWLHPAYAKLCAQEAPLTAKEGRVLGFERFAALCKIREEGFKKGLHLGGNDEMMASHGGTWQQQQGRSGPTREFPVCQHRCCKPPVELSGREKVFLTVVSGTEDL